MSKFLSQEPSIIIIVVPGPPKTKLGTWINDATLKQGVIVEECSADLSLSVKDTLKTVVMGRNVAPSHIDYDLMKKWLDECLDRKKSHKTCYKPMELNNIQFYVINYKTFQLQILTEEMEYLALSYIWGSSGPSSNSDKNEGSSSTDRLLSDLPKTINDAIFSHRKAIFMDRPVLHTIMDR